MRERLSEMLNLMVVACGFVSERRYSDCKAAFLKSCVSHLCSLEPLGTCRPVSIVTFETCCFVKAHPVCYYTPLLLFNNCLNPSYHFDRFYLFALGTGSLRDFVEMTLPITYFFPRKNPQVLARSVITTTKVLSRFSCE